MSPPATAAVLRPGRAEFSLEEVRIEAPGPQGVAVQMHATGICHTDMTCRDGFTAVARPVILGHEGAGVVTAVGSAVSSLSPGDHVVLTYWSCGACERCTADMPAYCVDFRAGNLSGYRPDGSTPTAGRGGPIAGHFFGQSSFATHCLASERNAVKVASDLSLAHLAPLGCSALTGAGAILDLIAPAPGSSLLVIGAGGVGLSAVMAAAASGVGEIVVVEPRAARRQLALEIGATRCLPPEDVTTLPAASIAAAFDTVGIPEQLAEVMGTVAPGGQLVIATAKEATSVLPIPLLSLVGNGVAVRGVRMGGGRAHVLIPHLVDLHRQGRFPIDRLISTYRLADIGRAFHDLETGATTKPILLHEGN